MLLPKTSKVIPVVEIFEYLSDLNVSPSLFQDYKTYLDFVLALENRKEPAALQYIFKLLDMENQGHLNVFSLNYFFRVSAAHASVKQNQKD